MRIIMADDDNLVRETVQAVLESRGHTVHAVADGAQLLEKLGHVQKGEPYDVVLSDYRMPILDGLQVLRRIKAMPAHDALPVIVMSADPIGETVERAGGIFIPKPATIADIEAGLERAAAFVRSKQVPPST